MKRASDPLLDPMRLSDAAALVAALHGAFLTLAVLTLVSSLSFWRLQPNDGESITKGVPASVT